MSNWYDKYSKGNGQYEPPGNWWRAKTREALQSELTDLWGKLAQQGKPQHQSCLIPGFHVVACPLGQSVPLGWIACCIERAREDLGMVTTGLE